MHLVTTVMKAKETPEASIEAPIDDRLLVKWLENQSLEVQTDQIQAKFDELILNAIQPNHASGNACIKLCYFVEQCMISKSFSIRNFVFSPKICNELCKFYIEWSEKNQSRSMRQVLDLISSLITRNSDSEAAASVKSSLLEKILRITGHQEAQPLVKPAFKCLEYLMGKHTISTETFIKAYGKHKPETPLVSLSELWDAFIHEIFNWMNLPDVSPAAGKFLVTIFKLLRSQSADQVSDKAASSWQQWLRRGLSKDPSALENVKNYIFLPLFKLDRAGSLVFLEELNRQSSISDVRVQDLDTHSLLQLAAIEVGKKAGLVEEPNTIQFKAPKKTPTAVILKEETISGLLSNASDTVRSLAFSVMVSSASPIRPFTAFALQTLRLKLGTLHSDTDAKFRNEVLSASKHMIDRLRGSIGFLAREIDNVNSRANFDTDLIAQPQPQLIFDAQASLATHIEFVEWYIGFLLQELVPTTSYQRHITALKAFEILLRSGILIRDASMPQAKKADNDTVWPFNLHFFTSGSMRLLLDLLMDPFEDVRSGAASVLKLASPENFTFQSSNSNMGVRIPSFDYHPNDNNRTINEGGSFPSDEKPLGLLLAFISRAETLSKKTGRADYADGVARSYELLYGLQPSAIDRLNLLTNMVSELEHKVAIAEQDLGRAVLEAPVHGTFAGLTLVWNSVDHVRDFMLETHDDGTIVKARLDELQQRLVNQCRRIWTSVREILCNESPEGHLPQDLDEVEIVDTKDVLSYSFRAVHESSNLMRTMVNKLGKESKEKPSIVSPKIFGQIGDLTFDQLSSLRHRGAFSTVSLTFARCCILTQVQMSTIGDLLEKWYQGALECIFEQVSTTRRSAGIPALLTGIMAANSKKPAFEDIMLNLKSISREPAHQSETDQTSVPQVHAMNSLKETFKSSILGRRAEGHIGDCLQIAVDSLKSEIWAIRNCGLLLLRSLIDSLFGTSDSKTAIEAGWDGKSIKISYEKYRNLPELLIGLLSAEVGQSTTIQPDISTVESVFPALDIVRRAGPPSTHRDVIYRLVMTHLGSRVWNVREMAAHALSVLVPQNKWATASQELLDMPHESSNLRHGSLMAVRFILERQTAINPALAIEGLTELIPSLVSSWTRDSTSNCPEIFTAHIEARNSVGVLLTSQRGRDHKDSHFSLFGPGPFDDFFEFTKPSSGYSTWHPSCISLARRAVCNVVLREDYTQLTEVFDHAMRLGTDVALAALTFMSGSTLARSTTAISEICQAYISTIVTFDSSEVRATALIELYNALASGFPSIDSGLGEISPALIKLAECLAMTRQQSPDLQNAELKMSGWLLLANIYPIRNDTTKVVENIRSWTRVVSLAGRKIEGFDTRLSAVLALDSFYLNVQYLENLPSNIMLPCFFTLYDCLNDDDSEIREIAAKTFSIWTAESCMPVAAQNAISALMLRDYVLDSLFAINVVSRMTGQLEIVLSENHVPESPELMYEAALDEDNTLFVEEDQNLFIDEVREVKFWRNVLENATSKTSDANEDKNSANCPALLTLLSWTLDAIKSLNAVHREDGVLGWSSKPGAFAACMRTIVCANTLLNCHGKALWNPKNPCWDDGMEQIIVELGNFVRKSSMSSFHESLLAEVKEGNSVSTVHRLGLEDMEFKLTLRRN